MENMEINRCKYCMCEIPLGWYCCKGCFDFFENPEVDHREEEEEDYE